MGVDIMGVDIMGVDILRLPHLKRPTQRDGHATFWVFATILHPHHSTFLPGLLN